MTSNSTSAMDRLVKRFRNDPDFMAYVLARYQDQERISDENLPEVLGTLPELVSRLALCRKPDVGAADFAVLVQEIADYTLIDQSLLANIIRQVSSLDALSKASQHQLLAAARDRGDAGTKEEHSLPTKKSEGEE